MRLLDEVGSETRINEQCCRIGNRGSGDFEFIYAEESSRFPLRDLRMGSNRRGTGF